MTDIARDGWNPNPRPVLPAVSPPVILRILARTNLTGSGCLEFLGACDKFGYAGVTVGGVSYLAHRITWAWFNGAEIPAGMSVDHLCRNRGCINPLHLDICTIGENLRRSPISMPTINKAKTHCTSGHPFAGDNLIVEKNGTRVCRTCRLRNQRAYRQRQREKVSA